MNRATVTTQPTLAYKFLTILTPDPTLITIITIHVFAFPKT